MTAGGVRVILERLDPHRRHQLVHALDQAALDDLADREQARLGV